MFYHLEGLEVYLQASSSIIKQMCWLWNDEKIGKLEGLKVRRLEGLKVGNDSSFVR